MFARGTLLDSDTDADDFPVLTVTPSVSGEYSVRVTMARCDTSICYYSLGVYGNRQAARHAQQWLS